ncbi:MAG: lytic transglycosylase domain-containing protein [Lachnospiraceae bacterium]|nr:lytic transglycosylase domain-containing protein [Lachnospiraceae bacterium]
MSAKQRHRKRKMEFIGSWILVVTFLLLLIGFVFLFLKPDVATENDEEIETVEICVIQPESIELEECVEEKSQVVIESVEPFGTIDFIPIDAEDTYISDEIQTLCIEIGEQTRYCPEFLMSIIESESSGRKYAENGPCKGVMQINTDWPEIAEYMEQHGYTDIYDYETNIRLGCYVLDLKREIYGDDIYAVLMGYNGSSDVIERVENGNYTDYAINVVNRTWELERLHEKTQRRFSNDFI